MRYLLIATAMSLGFAGTCLAAQPNEAQSKIAQSSEVRPQYPNAAHSLPYRCQTEGHKFICKHV
jgi:hypothetical protein